ncbi:hypothetical protein COCMIDRAFT_87 [Bipolaris oryzae ATCC 44560]|uniref:Uncharacterized protein n=1 Tax=Bipolaris oryzae ATCC 44560 TaxID=930090 RepID=W6ZMF7_COCMI|nr:uncharacterized protein COCMIDRAFT_87 [Bipolaris oryzae ATCC 44560]EUC51285.1 hypothetical protein COCMIDRAFT_87 [Bipolaris oryzae ATCC 44560]
MDEEEDIDIAAAMGFSSFGGAKKRKFDHENSPKAKADASGANSTKLGVRTKKVASREADEPEAAASKKIPATDSGLASFLARGQTLPETPLSPANGPAPNDQSAMEAMSFGGPPIPRAELNALHNGVQDENGDTAYFLPSFVEDPWAKLGKGNSA